MIVAAISLPWALAAHAQTVDGSEGKQDGVTRWRLPDPDGPYSFDPIQCWFGVGSDPDGYVYVVGSDHVNNSALYRIDPDTDKLHCLGDAKSAAAAANNLHNGETFEKFHVRPTWLDGRVYVASMDYSGHDNDYTNYRGFHWFAYDIADDAFIDVSADDPDGDGVGGEHAQLVAITADAKNGLLYGLSNPRAHLFQLDVATGASVDLGKHPAIDDNITFPGRYLWVNDDGRVHFTYDNGSLDGYECVYYWDPDDGFGRREDWELQNGVDDMYPGGWHISGNHIQAGQWSADGRRCYLSDRVGSVYRYDRDEDSFAYLGQAGFGDAGDDDAFSSRMLQLSRDESTIYWVNDKYWGREYPGYVLCAFDVETGASTVIDQLDDLDGDAGRESFNYHSGYDAWDNQGRFVMVSFGNTGTNDNVAVTRIDPVRLKVARGMIDNLITVGIQNSGAEITLSRSGGTREPLDVIVEMRKGGDLLAQHIVPIAGGDGETNIDAADMAGGADGTVAFLVVPDGADYVVGDNSAVTVDLSATTLRAGRAHTVCSRRQLRAGDQVVVSDMRGRRVGSRVIGAALDNPRAGLAAGLYTVRVIRNGVLAGGFTMVAAGR
jgi:hypothetical protein